MSSLSARRAKAHQSQENASPFKSSSAGVLSGVRRQIIQARPWPRIPDHSHRVPSFRRASGWLAPSTCETESALWGRWDYLGRIFSEDKLPTDPIPAIDFVGTAEPRVLKMLSACLDTVSGEYGRWRGWSSGTYFDYFLDWLLFGFGILKDEPKEPSPNAFDRLYQVFNVESLLAWPYDYFGDLLSESGHGQSQGFFPTPMEVCQLLCSMQIGGNTDARAKTVHDPCVGTGRMLMAASNRSLLLFGSDINSTCVKATMVNGCLYAPWIVRQPTHLLNRAAVGEQTPKPKENDESQLQIPFNWA